jgi:hypothetical protein
VVAEGAGEDRGATTDNTGADFLVIGHVVEDLYDDDWRPGGAVVYAGLLAHRIGLNTKVLTSCAPDFPASDVLPGIEVHRVTSPETTQIRNVYTPAGRRQWVPACAAGITGADLPSTWRTPAVALLGPVAGEVDPAIASLLSAGVLGIGAQGWLREIGSDGQVRPMEPRNTDFAPLLAAADAVFVSEEDLDPEVALDTVGSWAQRVPIVAFTHGDGGADVSFNGEWRHVAAFPAQTVDPTGAGDVFAAAFLIRYRETADAWEAARFASAAASCVVEDDGAAAAPMRPAIEDRLSSRPDIVARRA